MATAETLFDQVLGLPLVERRQLASLLIRSLPEDDDELLVVDQEFEDELLRRIEEIHSGKAKLVDMETSIARIRAVAMPRSSQ